MIDKGTGDAAPPVFFDAVIHPHRSLPAKGFFAVMAVLSVVSFAVSLASIMIGAWPITAFLGLDLLLVYIAFRVNYRSARQRESVRLTEESLVVERIGVRGDRRRWQFQPYWLRVILEEPDEDTNRLVLTSHGRSLVLGSFLGPVERRGFAVALKDALARWRAALSPPASLP